jgi:hypothetical protein
MVACNFLAGMEDFVELVVSRLQVEAELPGLRLVQLITGLRQNERKSGINATLT